MAAMEELARQIQSSVDACSDPDIVSWADSRFNTGSRRAGDALVEFLRRHVACPIKAFMEIEPAQRRFRGRVWWYAGGACADGAGAGGDVGRGKADKGRGRGRGKGEMAGGGVVPPLAK